MNMTKQELMALFWATCIVGAFFALVATVRQCGPVERGTVEVSEPVLTPVEEVMVADMMRTMRRSRADATAAVIAARPSPEEQRRMRAERRQREQEINDMYVGLCRDEPWLDRCR